MEPISLILGALLTGAAKTTVDLMAHDAYEGLKSLIKHKFESQGKSNSATILDKFEQKPEKTKALLEDELTEIGADQDQEIIKQAQKLMAQLNPEAAAEGKFSVQISGGTVQGWTQENRGTITQNFR